MDHLVAVVVALLVSLNPLEWFGLTPIESLKAWIWPQPEPEGFHPVYTLTAVTKVVALVGGALVVLRLVYGLIRWWMRSGGGGGPRGPSGTDHSRQPTERRYTERTGRSRR